MVYNSTGNEFVTIRNDFLENQKDIADALTASLNESLQESYRKTP